MTSGVFTIPLISTDGSRSNQSKEFASSAEHRHFIAGSENLLLNVLMDAVPAQWPRLSETQAPAINQDSRLGETRPQSRPPQFNPITLCGPTGVGKSHLLHGLVEHHKTWSQEPRVTLLTGADFARGFACAIEVDSVADWREKQRSVDLFVLDDVQELANKPAAQQELVHTIDALVDQDHQMILASRHAALDWNWMLPRLRSRLEGGLIIPVAPPGSQTQQHILREIVASHGLGSEATSILPATSGQLTYSQIRQAVLQYVQNLTNPLTSSENSRASTHSGSLPRIAKLVARQSQVKLSDLLGPSRRQTVVRARGVAFYLARILLQLSFDEIGKYFGGRDHTTVMHSWRKTTERLETDVRFKHDVNKLRALLADNFEIQRL